MVLKGKETHTYADYKTHPPISAKNAINSVKKKTKAEWSFLCQIIRHIFAELPREQKQQQIQWQKSNWMKKKKTRQPNNIHKILSIQTKFFFILFKVSKYINKHMITGTTVHIVLLFLSLARWSSFKTLEIPWPIARLYS